MRLAYWRLKLLRPFDLTDLTNCIILVEGKLDMDIIRSIFSRHWSLEIAARGSAIVEKPRDALRWLTSCQLLYD